MIDRRTLMISGAAFAGLAAGPVRSSDALDPVVARLRGFVEQGELPFASLRVAQRGRVLAEAHISGVETIGPESLYRIYSMTKPVAAAGAVLLIEDGALTLDTPVAGIVPEFADLQVLGEGDARIPARVMTVGHLLTHTCGLANSWGDARVAPLYRQAGLTAAAWMYDPEIGGLAGFARRLGQLPLEHQPGAGLAVRLWAGHRRAGDRTDQRRAAGGFSQAPHLRPARHGRHRLLRAGGQGRPAGGALYGGRRGIEPRPVRR
nr:serine hydrolase domain-containing protein [Brevundimonas denitrificans]